MHPKRFFVPIRTTTLNWYFCIFRVLSFGTIADHGILDGNELRLLPAIESGFSVSFILIHTIINLLNVLMCRIFQR